MTRGSFLRRAALTMILAPLLAVAVGACSMANFPGYKPAGVHVAIAPQPAGKRPAAKPRVEEAFVPLAFAEAPRSAGNVDSLISKYAAIYDVRNRWFAASCSERAASTPRRATALTMA